MKCPQLLFVCWCSSILAVSSCITVDEYSCVSAYWDKVECELNITGDPVAQSHTNYSLRFTGDREMYTCPLILKKHTYGCVCKVYEGTIFKSYTQYNVQLCNGSGCHSLIKEFYPSENIQLTPPKEVEVQQAPNVFNVTWRSGYEDHKYLVNDLKYELLLQKSPNSKSQKHHPQGTLQSISRSQLDADATYCTRVRSKPSNEGYKAIWSEWSPQICWKNEVQKEQENIIMTLTRSLVPVCVIVGVLLLVFHIPAARTKIKTLSHTPSPAPFFQPLFQQHEGNLQEWLSPQGKFALTYKTEEILITDAVTVEPKPKTKDPEENQNVCNTAVTQLTFPQCQTSYVGLPGMHMAPQLTPITTICPAGDTPYTRLPGSVWGFSIREEQVMLSPPQHVFKSSCSDSGCSFEDLTQSPECSLPNSPVEASSPPRYCKDYCILNKTAEGVVPVLVSK
ncbi:cytokine receptor-like factor 2 [Paralichthys olivaceus]|uniref:cytokine receptor-like factor 2 n=1 Tax=Paralichthys olivaceus TaxID=8255 RepID=UPI0037522B45